MALPFASSSGQVDSHSARLNRQDPVGRPIIRFGSWNVGTLRGKTVELVKIL